MSTGAILSVLSNIPWSQVIDNAPKVADGASRLWSSVKRFGKNAPPDPELENSPSDAPLAATEVLRARLDAHEDSLKSLQEQMQASSELIKALADQNTQLVARIEMNRAQLQRVTWAAAVAGGVLFAAVLFLLIR